MRHAVDAVDVWEDEQHGEVPILIHKRGEAYCTEGDMMREQGGRRRVGGEQLDVKRVVVVDGDHGFAVVVQIFQQDLAQGVDFACVGRRGITAEEIGLLLEGAEQCGELEGDGQVRGEFGGAVEHEAKIEEEFVARVEGRRQANWVAEDAIRVGNDREDARAKLLSRNDVR